MPAPTGERRIRTGEPPRAATPLDLRHDPGNERSLDRPVPAGGTARADRVRQPESATRDSEHRPPRLVRRRVTPTSWRAMPCRHWPTAMAERALAAIARANLRRTESPRPCMAARPHLHAVTGLRIGAARGALAQAGPGQRRRVARTARTRSGSSRQARRRSDSRSDEPCAALRSVLDRTRVAAQHGAQRADAAAWQSEGAGTTVDPGAGSDDRGTIERSRAGIQTAEHCVRAGSHAGPCNAHALRAHRASHAAQRHDAGRRHRSRNCAASRDAWLAHRHRARGARRDAELSQPGCRCGGALAGGTRKVFRRR